MRFDDDDKVGDVQQDIELTKTTSILFTGNTMMDNANTRSDETERSTLILDHDGENDESSYDSISSDEHVRLSSTSPTSAMSTPSSILTSTNIFKYFQRLKNVLSLNYLVFLGIIKLITCGLYASVIGTIFLPVFQRLGVDAATEQVLVLVCTLPYAASPLLGVISDLIPIGGYHKKYWMVLSIIIGALGSAVLGFGSSEGTTISTEWTVVCLVAMNLELAVLNLLNEGKYSELIRDHPAAAADIVTFQQACAALGSLMAKTFVGPLSDNGNLRVVFLVALGLSLVPLFPTLLGWLPEARRSIGENGLWGCGESCCMFDFDRCLKQKHTIRIALLVGIVGPALTVVSAYLDQTLGITIIAIVLLLVVVLSYATLSPTIASVVTYTIVTKASSPSMRSALQYFYTANDTCLPDGPHFSYTYYLTYNGIVGEIFMLVAVVVYQTYMSQWSYRSVLLTTLLLDSGGRLVDVALVTRWNMAIGIPDSIFFLLGSSVLESMTSMLYLLPFGAIVGKICPPGTETATFAFVAGVSKYSTTFSSLVGSSLMNLSGLKTTGDECDFSALPMLVVGLSVVLPVAAGLPAIYYLIPDVMQSESLTDGLRSSEEHVLLDEDETEVDSEIGSDDVESSQDGIC